MVKRVFHGIARFLSKRHFGFAKLYQRWWLRRTLATRPDEVLVYQMGKVGSSTIVTSLQASRKDLLVHHIHRLGEEELRQFEAFARESFKKDRVNAAARAGFVTQLVRGEYLQAQLADGNSPRAWKVVTLVRDPVARNLSAFFEVLEYQMDYDLQDNLRAKGAEAVAEDLCELFLDRYPDHEFPLTFFESFARVVGVDVFATAFPRDIGYEVYTKGAVTVLLLRLEDLDRCSRQAFRQAFGLEHFELVGKNVGSDKAYSEIYRRVQRRIRLPDSYLSKMYGSKYATHFYSAKEIEQFRAKWTRGADA
jgi:hypothetical protein